MAPHHPYFLVFILPCVVLSLIVSGLICVNNRKCQKWWLVTSDARPWKTLMLLSHSLGSLALRKARWHVLMTLRQPCAEEQALCQELFPAANHVSGSRAPNPSWRLHCNPRDPEPDQNCLAKLPSSSWPTETVWIKNVHCCFKLLSFEVTCYITINN